MINFLKKNIDIIIIVFFSLLPIIKTYGGLNIGHDTLVPLIPQNSLNKIYQWVDVSNGLYLSMNTYVWVFIFYALTQIGLSIYQAAFVYQFLIFFLSGFGLYKLYNLFNNGNKLFGLIPAILIILSPHYLDHMIYYQGTVGIIWCIYFIFKFIRNKKLLPLDIVFFALSFGIITDLPNPKYHIFVATIGILAIFFGLITKALSFKDILKNKLTFAFIILTTLYLTLPYLYFTFNYLQNPSVKINVKLGYKETGAALDYGYATLDKMIRLFHTPNLNSKDAELITTPFFSFAYFMYALIILGIFPFVFRFLDSQSKKVYATFYVLILFLLFISKSTNPPFGFIYEYLLSNFQGFAFMRTTAGIVIFAAIFYALIYGKVFQYIAYQYNDKFKNLLISVFLLLPIIIGYPIWSGHYFLNRSNTNPNVDRSKYGLKIPDDYFKSADFIKKINLDTKIDVYPYATGYQYNHWGYYGFIFYPWLINKPMISFDKRTPSGKVASNTNALYIYHDKTLNDNYPVYEFLHQPEVLVFSSKIVDIYKKQDKDFIPHFYSLSSSGKNPIIEFKKINPTKYRVVIHKAHGTFDLVFTESYHSLWKMYLKDYKLNKNDSSYVFLPFSESYAATKKDLGVFLENKFLTSVGPNFISKDIKGTIQNNNLQDGNFYETFVLSRLSVPHNTTIGYANKWRLNPKIFCRDDSKSRCIKNSDGSYDFELVIEFWPQKIATISYLISGLTIIILVFYHTILRFSRVLDQKKPLQTNPKA